MTEARLSPLRAAKSTMFCNSTFQFGNLMRVLSQVDRVLAELIVVLLLALVLSVLLVSCWLSHCEPVPLHGELEFERPPPVGRVQVRRRLRSVARRTNGSGVVRRRARFSAV